MKQVASHKQVGNLFGLPAFEFKLPGKISKRDAPEADSRIQHRTKRLGINYYIRRANVFLPGLQFLQGALKLILIHGFSLMGKAVSESTADSGHDRFQSLCDRVVRIL